MAWKIGDTIHDCKGGTATVFCDVPCDLYGGQPVNRVPDMCFKSNIYVGVSKMTQRVVSCFLSLVMWIAVLGFTGCSQEDPFPPGDKGAVYDLTRSVSDAAGRPRFADLFAEGAVPDKTQEEKMNLLVCIPEGDIQFESDTVKFEVTVEDMKANATVMTWSARKVGETWKLTDVPLPP